MATVGESQSQHHLNPRDRTGADRAPTREKDTEASLTHKKANDRP